MRDCCIRLRWAAAVVGCCALAGMAVEAGAQPYPTRPIRLLVPLAPGGGNDNVARLVGSRLSVVLGQQVVVDNRPGGGSVIASEIVVRSPPDGHTLYLVSTSFTVAPGLQKKLPFDTLNDFAPITRLAVAPGALIAHPSLPVKSVKDLIALAKARPGQITFGSASVGAASHLGGELFKMLAGVDMVHVPYKGSALITTALLAGEIAVGFTNPISSLPHVKTGRLRLLAVTTTRRWPLLPDLPTIAEAGVAGYELLIWNGLVARAATPQPIIARLHRELTKVMSAPDIAERLAVDASRPMIEAPAEFAAFLKDEIAKWARVIHAAGIRND